MSHFELPVATTQEIDTILLRFWWGKNDIQGLPWVAWKDCNLPKFNDALLAKQAWRIYSKLNCLFSKGDHVAIKGRPCRHQSYGWVSLLAGIEVLKKGCSYIVGDGKDIRVFKDNWLPVNPPRPATTTINCDLRVSDLITTSPYKHWNLGALQAYLSDEDQRLVWKIYLSQTDKADKLIWSHTRDGNYTVSSGYKVARHAPESLLAAPPIPYVDNAGADVKEWISHLCLVSPISGNIHASPSTLASSSWKRPDHGLLKCNYDAAYDLKTHQVRGAWIIRNSYGHPYMWGSANLGFTLSSLDAEAKALLMAMQTVWAGGYSNMIFEGDSEILVKSLTSLLPDSTIQNISEEITFWRNRFSTSRFTFVKHTGNQAAHIIARKGPANSIFKNCKVYPPRWLTPTLYSDIMNSY
ncbi:hypothetical protein Bca52824_017740 [Brassica carinata]|uniref:RNase H type-1 domain-containing protein n=1 Tax=Brassica carinata TaxID=52824 RepID=A0A8X8AXS4_BRACI|nr:hypothetical protein Bca52824_017740 [Brassica carinata]